VSDKRKKLAALMLNQMEMAAAAGVPYVAEARNIDVSQLPEVPNRIPGEGGISTVRSMGISEDGKEVLIPTVVEGQLPASAEEAERRALEYYRRTGKHLGKYATRGAADSAAMLTHEREALRTGR
jgi:hypothetical protein